MIDFWKEVSGVVHIGGNIGQEVEFYSELGVPVIWIEPIPEYYNMLREKIKKLKIKNQKVIRELIADKRSLLELNVASNHGASSSIFKFSGHSKIWPKIEMVKTIRMAAKPLPDVFITYKIRDINQYNCLIIDTQGSELLILNGARSILANFEYIRVEAADFDAYSGGCQLKDIDNFLVRNGYDQIGKERTAGKPGIGNYFEVLYGRK